MDEKSLKTSLWQRVVILVIAFLLIGGTLLTYAMVVLNNNNPSAEDNDAYVNQLYADYDVKGQAMTARAAELSPKYFNELLSYKTQVKAYNSAAANNAKMEIKDLKVGSGKTLAEDDTDYMAYYIGWCADGSIFDSSFNDNEDPTSLGIPLVGSSNMIEGWLDGIVGMKLGGVRQLTISGELAYGSTQEICGGYNSPLKFIILALEPDAEIVQLNDELLTLQLQLMYAIYGEAL